MLAIAASVRSLSFLGAPLDHAAHNISHSLHTDQPQCFQAAQPLRKADELIRVVNSIVFESGFFHHFVARSRSGQKAKCGLSHPGLGVRCFLAPLIQERAQAIQAHCLWPKFAFNIALPITLASHLFSCQFLRIWQHDKPQIISVVYG